MFHIIDFEGDIDAQFALLASEVELTSDVTARTWYDKPAVHGIGWQTISSCARARRTHQAHRLSIDPNTSPRPSRLRHHCAIGKHNVQIVDLQARQQLLQAAGLYTAGQPRA